MADKLEPSQFAINRETPSLLAVTEISGDFLQLEEI
jgi:hypothetical protein